MTLGKSLKLIETDVKGWKPAMTYKDAFQPARQEVDIVECYEDVDQPGTGYQKVKTELFRIMDAIKANKFEQKVVCLDSLSTLGDQSLRSVLSAAGRLERGTLAPGRKIEIQDYGRAMQQIEDILALLRYMPIMTIVIAHDAAEEVDGIQKKIINVVGSKLAPKIPPYFDEVWYSTVELGAGGVTNRVIQTLMSPSIPARSRDSLENKTQIGIGLPAILEKMGYKL